MEYEIFIDKEHSEKCIIYAPEKTELICQIEQLILDNATTLMGYSNDEYVPLKISDIYCFTVEDNKVFALLKTKSFKVKDRLYKLEQKLPKSFIKINQSCIANIKAIERFDASFSGTLTVIFKNGHKDYVSRRNLKNVKERLGISK